MTNETILGWLTGGIYDNFSDFFYGCLEVLVRFGSNISNIFLGGLFYIISPFLPDLTPVNNALNSVLNYILPYVLFVKDMLLLPDWVFNYIIVSIIFRVSAKFATYLISVAVNLKDKLL